MTKQAIMREPGMPMDWLLRGSCCGIVKRVPTRSRIGSMRLLSPIVRMSMRAGPILVLVFLAGCIAGLAIAALTGLVGLPWLE